MQPRVAQLGPLASLVYLAHSDHKLNNDILLQMMIAYNFHWVLLSSLKDKQKYMFHSGFSTCVYSIGLQSNNILHLVDYLGYLISVYSLTEQPMNAECFLIKETTSNIIIIDIFQKFIYSWQTLAAVAAKKNLKHLQSRRQDVLSLQNQHSLYISSLPCH